MIGSKKIKETFIFNVFWFVFQASWKIKNEKKSEWDVNQYNKKERGVKKIIYHNIHKGKGGNDG